MDDDQAWFWEPEWLAGEHEADDQAERGEGETFYLDEGFLESLNSQ